MLMLPGADLDTLAEPFQAKAYRLVSLIEGEGLPFAVYETRRTMTKQQRYFMQGRAVVEGITTVIDKAAVITKARPGRSAHNWGLALDCVLDVSHPFWVGETRPLHPWDTGYDRGHRVRPLCAVAWDRLGRVVKTADLEWGGYWKFTDMPHVQLFGWERYRPVDWQAVVARELAAGR